MTLPDLEALQPWLDARFDRAEGPGGQNVNKRSTRVTLLFDFASCPLLPEYVRVRLTGRYASRLAADGRLQVGAQEARSQHANRALAEQRLIEWLTACWRVAPPRRATRPTRGSQERRIREKKQAGARKSARRAPPPD